jgi:hypothetical protein
VASPALAQKPSSQLDGFLDIPFGSDQETVKKQLPTRAHARFDRTKSKVAARPFLLTATTTDIVAPQVGFENIVPQMRETRIASIAGDSAWRCAVANW